MSNYNQNLTDMMEKPTGYYANIRHEMLPYVPKNVKKVLEIGCGDALFGQKLKDMYGCEVWGIELFPESAKQAAKNIDKVLTGDVHKLVKTLPDNSFDCVVGNDIFEHLEDPYEVLRELRKKLKKNGTIVSSIPNVRYFHNLYDLLMGKNWDYRDAGILDKTHLRFFTINSIPKMFQDLGYEMTTLEGINPMPTQPREYKLWNFILRGKLSDTQYMQFACVATKK